MSRLPPLALRCAITACCLTLIASAIANEPLNIELPEMGDPTGTSFTPLQEQQLGEAFFRNLHSQLEINQDPEVTDYVQNLGHRLTTNSDKPEQPFHFFVVNSGVINAFAGPGGYIGVNSGLILASESESELASVIAHEIAHITQRHLFQTFQDSARLSLPMAAAMLAAMLVGSQSGQAGQAALLATQAALTQHQINFTRDNEAEADRVGMQILSKSSFDPRGMPTFFERLQQSTRFSGHSVPEFLLTHPVTTSRISDTRGRSEGFPYRQYPDSMSYQLIRAKLRVQTSRDGASAVAAFRPLQQQGTPEQQDVARYGLALALIRDYQKQDGFAILQTLITKYPDQPYFVNALAEAQMEAKEYDAAEKTFELGLKRFPDYRSMTLNYVRNLLTQNKADAARKLLQQYSLRHKPGPNIFELMAEIYSQLGQPAESHRFVAEYYYASGQTRAAIQQLALARELAGNDRYVAAVIDERLKELKQEALDQRKE